MQIALARLLNKVLLAFLAVVAVLFVGIFVVARFAPAWKYWYIAGFALVTIVLTFYFRYLEYRWDKKIITKMAREGKIALFEIKSAKKIMTMRDTAFKTFLIYELTGTLWTREGHEKIEKTFDEKFNRTTEEIPSGFVYVTWDEAKSAQIFIIPNMLIGALPTLKPLVEQYENDTKIPLKYLDAHYDNGMVLKTYEESLQTLKNTGERGS